MTDTEDDASRLTRRLAYVDATVALCRRHQEREDETERLLGAALGRVEATYGPWETRECAACRAECVSEAR